MPITFHSRCLDRRGSQKAFLKFLFRSALVSIALGNIPIQASPILKQVNTIFVIAMENHNFTQPSPLNSPQQIFTNPAAPYINSLITPGNSNALHVSYSESITMLVLGCIHRNQVTSGLKPERISEFTRTACRGRQMAISSTHHI